MRNVSVPHFLFMTMLTVYGIPNCDTVKKTLDWLKTNNIAYRFHNYKTEGINQQKLEEWLTQVPLEKLVNKASATFKGFSEEEKSQITDPASAMKLMTERSSVIKRPVVENGKILAIGFKPEEYKAIFNV